MNYDKNFETILQNVLQAIMGIGCSAEPMYRNEEIVNMVIYHFLIRFVIPS